MKLAAAVQGLVEQNGSVWVQNLSLNVGTNVVTLTASNAVGGVSVINFNMNENDVGLVINPLTSDQMNQSSITVPHCRGHPPARLPNCPGARAH